MSHFKQFCDSIPKNKNGYVPDLLDMDNDAFLDQATVAYLKDMKNYSAAEMFYYFGDDLKGEYYRSLEIVMQDAIDAYNQAIDDASEKAKNLELIDDVTWIGLLDPDYKYRHFNQAEIDAGFSGTGKEFY